MSSSQDGRIAEPRRGTEDLRSGEGMTAPPLLAGARQIPIPLTFAQQRLWIIDKMFPGSPAYNTQLTVRLEGPLSLTALESAINQLVLRHETLRTRFPAINGQPEQEILPFTKPELKLIQLGTTDPREREDEALRLAQAEIPSFLISRKDLWCAGCSSGLTAPCISFGSACIISSPTGGRRN